MLAILGGGAWGTALAFTGHRANLPVRLWAFEPEVTAEINASHRNQAYLPGIDLPAAITATSSLAEAVDGADIILLVTPAQHLRRIVSEAVPYMEAGVPLVICAKGIEQATGDLLSQAIAKPAAGHPIAVLSGPTFAREVASGLPTAVTVACEDSAVAERIVYALKSPMFRPYSSTDVVGVQVGGAVKNVIAIAAGVTIGLQFGENARAALVTRGLAEIVRLGTALGGRAETLMGLSGLGDLMLTCGSEQSRNMSLGIELARGLNATEILAARTSVAEGAYTATAVHNLAQRLGIETPISTAVHNVLTGELDLAQAIGSLLERPVKAEVG